MSFTIYPAIDLKDSKAVRLKQGDINKSQVFSLDPADTAKQFQSSGAKWIHVVDLNGAFAGKTKNLSAIKKIVSSVSVPVQLGGGIRSIESIKQMIEDIGVSRIILGTAAINNPNLVKEAVNKYGDKIAVGIDAKNGIAAANGWAEASEVTAVSLTKQMKDIGIKTIIYTDIQRDGMMKGPNISQTKKISDIGGIDVILSGGVSCTDDIIAAKEAGFAGAITGRAIYEGVIDLKEVIKLC